MILNTIKIVAVTFLTALSTNAMANHLSTKQVVHEKKLTAVDYEKLDYVKQNLNSLQFSLAYKNLLKTADKAMTEGSFSVMEKTQTPPSGSKHDYLSIGPYWWPDPTKADGLPWIRKDGKVNPLTREGSTDFETATKMFKNTSNLALAYFFTDDKKYANKAVELLKVWFLKPETKMNPNLNFAQGIPGMNSGRGIGIIEFGGITNIITAIEILEINHAMDAKTSEGLRQWFADYLQWLQTSENGVFEKNTKNNHGTWYDVQVSSILLFLDQKEAAKQVLEAVKTERIASQINAKGEQPHELERTKALSYSIMNLRGFTQLAYLGRKVGVDLWNYKSKDGASIPQAYEFLKPYTKGEKKWNYKQIHDLDGVVEDSNELFMMAGSLFNVKEYTAIGAPKDGKSKSLFYFEK
ncbi:alginate lyase family protein [Flavobacterium faecale]|uniref:alginate lyase family protein n=1 Tax=Flavobacterium faecale TaxID=1355330 RepID=UPI003AAAEE07